MNDDIANVQEGLPIDLFTNLVTIGNQTNLCIQDTRNTVKLLSLPFRSDEAILNAFYDYKNCTYDH